MRLLSILSSAIALGLVGLTITAGGVFGDWFNGAGTPAVGAGLSQAKLYPDCADTAHYFGASLAYYLLATRTAQSGNYGAVLSDLRKGADALTWMKSEPNVQGALDFPGPNGNY